MPVKSEWRVRAETAFLSHPAWQVYRLKDRSADDVRANREVLTNCNTKEYAEILANQKNKYEAEHFWEQKA